MTTILHIDTATDTGTVFCTIDGQIVATAENTATRDHAATINQMIAAVLKTAGATLQTVDAVAVCAGPGSYTGLRIGLATAKGICYATGAKLMLHPKLVLLMNQLQKAHPQYEMYASLLFARQDEYFLAAMAADGSIICPPAHVNKDSLDQFLIMYNNKQVAISTDVDIETFIKTKSIRILTFNETLLQKEPWAEYSLDCFSGKIFDDLVHSEPFYLKQPFVTKSNKSTLPGL